MAQTPESNGKVCPRLCDGLGKTELILSRGNEQNSFPYQLDNTVAPDPQIVEGFKAFMGVPRHHANDQTFIIDALQGLGARHDRLLDLAEEIFDEVPFAPLRLLQVYGFSWFGHVLSATPPSLVVDFARGRDEAISTTLGAIST
jgi:hypothetical protein